MCIVVYKPKDIDFPSKEVLENCFRYNDDGAGFMYAKDGKVFIQKGYMTFESFYKALKKSIARNKGGKDVPYVFHFRISTQGGVRADCTHPYPLSEKMNDLRKTRTVAQIGIAHNGIISLTSENFSKKQLNYNDTMTFITEYLSLIIKDINYYKDSKTLKLIEKLSESKLAILGADGHCSLIGDKWIEYENCFFSNDTFEARFIPYHYCFNEEDFYFYESLYNDETGLYDFDYPCCPMAKGEYGYCECCKSYPNCIGTYM